MLVSGGNAGFRAFSLRSGRFCGSIPFIAQKPRDEWDTDRWRVRALIQARIAVGPDSGVGRCGLLKLKRVQILGFKSFCDRTEVHLSGEGIAAVVGPNGCGKSNISDAVTWVLGEQSAKSLRGIKMEDVIFAGTRDRKPTGMVEVSLTLV